MDLKNASNYTGSDITEYIKEYMKNKNHNLKI